MKNGRADFDDSSASPAQSISASGLCSWPTACRSATASAWVIRPNIPWTSSVKASTSRPSSANSPGSRSTAERTMCTTRSSTSWVICSREAPATSTSSWWNSARWRLVLAVSNGSSRTFGAMQKILSKARSEACL